MHSGHAATPESMVRLALLTLLMLAAPALAGTQSVPELTDPAGDRTETAAAAGCAGPIGSDAEFPDVDLVAAWFEESDGNVILAIQTEAPVTDADISALFRIAAGPTSVFGSTASGTEHEVLAAGTAVTAGASSATQTDDVLRFTMARTLLGASGGDVLEDLRIGTSRTVAAGPGGVCPEQTATDIAPDAGTSTPYTLARPAVVAAGAILLLDATWQETLNGTATTRQSLQLTTTDPNATVELAVRLQNTGSDVDVFQFNASVPAHANTTFEGLNVSLDPGETADVLVPVSLASAPVRQHDVLLHLDSQRGVDTTTVLTIDVQAPPAVAAPPTSTTAPPVNVSTGRMPAVGGGTFLQTAAEGIGFDGPFGEHAETVLVAVVLLVLVLLVFLAMAVAGRHWFDIKVTPRHITASPGQTAEFQVKVRNRKRRYHDALAYFDGDPSWKTGLLLKPNSGGAVPPLTAPADEAELAISARDQPGDGLDGTLRVQVPASAGHDQVDDVVLNIVPVEEGRATGRHRARAKVRVRADNPGVPAAPAATPDAPPVRLSGVTHEPREPDIGDPVTTTATLENDGAATIRLRVVLQLDGREHAEQTVEVPSHAARAVVFPWTAGSGNNRVRVQVYMA